MSKKCELTGKSPLKGHKVSHANNKMKRKFPNTRLRRLRTNSPIRNLIRESTLSQNDLIQPIFLIDGNNKSQKIKSMPEITRMSIDLAVKEIRILKKLGLPVIIRPSFTLGGTGGGIAKTKKEFDELLKIGDIIYVENSVGDNFSLRHF